MERTASSLLVLTLAVTAVAASADDSGPPRPPPIGPQRYDEDYSYLDDPANRSGAWWEPLKLVPLGPATLTFGDELRLRYEHYWNNNFGVGKLPTEDYLRYRELPYVAARAGELRAFGQLQIAYAARSPLTKNPFLDQTGIDLLQAFLEWRVPVGGGHLTLRGGRQVLLYGSGRLVNAGPNIRTSFDGAVASWEHGAWRVDALYARPVDPHSENFDDWPSGARALWSLYATWALPRIGPRAGLDLYYFGFRNGRATFNQGSGEEHRHTLGTRFFGTREAWQWDFEADLQLGKFGSSQIRAFSIALDEGYTFAELPLRPFFGLRTAILSGDGDPHDGTLGTFNPMFSEGGYFGENAVLGPANLIVVRPLLEIVPVAGVRVAVSGTLHWRARRGDGIYDLGLGVLRPNGGSSAYFVGPQADLALGWEVNRNLSFAASTSILWAGRFVQDTGPSKTVYFFGAHLLFRY